MAISGGAHALKDSSDVGVICLSSWRWTLIGGLVIGLIAMTAGLLLPLPDLSQQSWHERAALFLVCAVTYIVLARTLLLVLHEDIALAVAVALSVVMGPGLAAQLMSWLWG